jgi:hypothetical protein
MEVGRFAGSTSPAPPVAAGVTAGWRRAGAVCRIWAARHDESDVRFGVKRWGNRPAGIEHDLLPLCEQYNIPVMAYSPLGGLGASLLRDPTLAGIATAHGCSAAAVALAWTIRSGHVIAIPESGSVAHVKENAVALSLTLTQQELQALDAAHPPGGR